MKQDDKLNNLINTALGSLSLELWGVEIFNAKTKVVRVYIDKPQGVSLDDCAAASRQIGAALDVADYFTVKYMLEVSSPGIDRVLFNIEQFAQYIDKEVKLKLYTPVDEKRNIVGVIKEVQGNLIKLTLEDDSEFVVDLVNVSKANLIGALS